MPWSDDPAQDPAIVALRKELLQQHASDTSDMNLTAVYAFLETEGIPITPWIRVSRTEFNDIWSLSQELGLSAKCPLTNEHIGVFHQGLGLIVLVRPSALHRRLYPYYDETGLIHEQVHGAGGKVFTSGTRRYGLVEYNRAGYAGGRLFDEGLSLCLEDRFLSNVLGSEKVYTSAQSYAHDCLELLFRQDPKLMPALRHAHEGGPMEPVKEIVSRIGGAEIFNKLYSCRDEERDYKKAYKATLAALKP